MARVHAVVTTGIYCKPSCSGRPLPQHVRPFGLAAAAEAAGYRACLRCRPYREPQSLPWQGPELVCRAVQLILDGALDGGTETDLGRRLGVSARHLRRLFGTHVGVTPDGLARSARAHFARRLLDDTDLTITEVAFTAGYGSLRQFNRACREIFRASPRVLRSFRRKSDRLIADGGLLLRLPFHGPLDWDALLAHLAAQATPGVEHVAAGAYRRTFVTGGHAGALELTRGGGDHLLLRIHLPRWNELLHLVNRVRRVGSLDLDLAEPARVLAGDPVVGPLLRARPGVRPPGTFDPFETGVRAIIGQFSSGPQFSSGATQPPGRWHSAAAGMVARDLVERVGTPVPGLQALGLTHTFPTAETLATADLSGLRLGSPVQGALRSFARTVAAGALPLDRSASLERFTAAAGAVPGLEKATIRYLALRLGEPDAWPLAAPADRWRPWRAVAAAHLWARGNGHAPAAPAPTVLAGDRSG